MIASLTKILIAVVCFVGISPLIYGQSKVIITGQIDNNVPSDTISLQVLNPYGYDAYGDYNQNTVLETLTSIPVNGKFKFDLKNHGSHFYFKIYLSSRRDETFGSLLAVYASEHLMASAGDSINIDYHKNGLNFSGIGGVKNECIYAMKHAEDKIAKPAGISLNNVCNYYKAVKESKLEVLEAFRKDLSAVDCEQLTADVIGDEALIVYNFGDQNIRATKQSKGYPQFLHDYGFNLRNEKLPVINKESFIKSRSYAHGLYLKEKTDHSYDNTISKRGKVDLYWYLKEKYSGLLRDQLVTWNILEMSALSELSDQKIQDALSYVKDETARKELLPLNESFDAGSPMLDFPFKDSLNNTVKLSDYKGKVVLIDIWFTGCGGCIEVAKAMPKVENIFKNNPDVVFVSLSIDRNKEDWQKSIRSNGRVNNDGLYHYTHYTTASTKYIYTGGSGYNNAFIKKYVPSGTYPHLMLVGKDTKVFSSSPPKPDSDAPGLIALIKKALKEPQ